MIFTIEPHNKDGTDLPMFSRYGKSTVSQFMQLSQRRHRNKTPETTETPFDAAKPFIDIAAEMHKILVSSLPQKAKRPVSQSDNAKSAAARR